MEENFFSNYVNAEKLLDDPDIIHKLSVVTTHYAYRNGPVEDMHADGKLSENDIEELYEFMQIKLTVVFNLILEQNNEMIKKYLLMGCSLVKIGIMQCLNVWILRNSYIY